MESYITNRYQYVEIDNTNSDTLPIGVAQGSILGPLLFIIYINDIVSSSKLFDFIMYVDDTTLSTTLEFIIKDTNNSDPESIINKELQNINDWLKSNKLSENIAKCKYMIFHTPQKRVKPLSLQIENNIVERVYGFNFIGLIMNENLNWKSHVKAIFSVHKITCIY